MNRCGCLNPRLSTDGTYCTACGRMILVELGAPIRTFLSDFDDSDVTPRFGKPTVDPVAMRVAEKVDLIEHRAHAVINAALVSGGETPGQLRAKLADALDPLIVLDIVTLLRRELRRS